MLSKKIIGSLIGYAIGDALGLGTEFMTRQEVARRYPEGLTEYKQIIRDAHRSQWPRGSYTADTRMVTLLAQSVIDRNDVDNLDYAARLQKWYHSNEGFDCGPHLILILQHPEFATEPLKVAKEIYKNRGLDEAHNEHLGRAMLIGMFPERYEEMAIQNCLLTHPSTRCQASSAIISTMAHELLWHNRPASLDQLIGIARRLDDTSIPFLEIAHDGDIAELELDDDESFWYSRKAMSAALWALWHHTDPEEALHEIISWGGDADTNAALALGLLGLKYGVESMPGHLIETLTDHENIINLGEAYAKTVLRKNRR